jgi:Tol biopolymer transport system component
MDGAYALIGRQFYGDLPYSPESSEICIVGADGDNQERLTDDRSIDRSPKWSPAKAEFAFISTRDGERELYIMDVESKQRRKIGGTEGITDFAWSPDGQRIAFALSPSGAEPDKLSILSLDNYSFQQLVSGPIVDSPSWSPDGENVAYIAGSTPDACELRVIRPDSGTVTKSPLPAICGTGTVWSPNGAQVAYVAMRADAIIVLDVLQNIPRSFSNEALRGFSNLAWSSDGERIFALTSAGRLFALNTFTGDWQLIGVLDDATLMSDQAMSLSPDGRRIVFVRATNEHRNASIWAIDIDGSNLVRLTP